MNENKCIECNNQTDKELTALRSELADTRRRLAEAREALQSIAEYWNGGNESAIDAAEVMTERAHAALTALPSRAEQEPSMNGYIGGAYKNTAQGEKETK